MRLLERHFPVTTRYGGGFVQSIAGAAGDGAQHDWFFYVNGIEAAKGAAATAVNRGDRVWWDLHDWSQTQSVPAVVGSFPEPFVHGIRGKRYPTVIECAGGEQAVCDGIATALHTYGVKAPEQLLGTGSGTDSLGILVGTWAQLEPLVAARLIDKGPGSGGVYAHFHRGSLQLLDPRGRVAAHPRRRGGPRGGHPRRCRPAGVGGDRHRCRGRPGRCGGADPGPPARPLRAGGAGGPRLPRSGGTRRLRRCATAAARRPCTPRAPARARCTAWRSPSRRCCTRARSSSAP